MKKKLLSLLLIAALVLSFTACDTPSPTEVTTSFLQAIKEQNTEAVASVYADSNFSIAEVLGEEADLESEDEISKYFTDEVFPKLLEFDYEVLEEKIDGEKATVDVKITTYTLGDAFTAFFGDYLTQAFALAFGDASDEAMESLAISLLKEKIGAMEKTYSETVTIALSQKDGAWVIDELDDDSPFVNAVLGGMIKSVETLEGAFDN